MSSEITVTEHLLLQQQRAPQATGHFTALFHDLVLSAKIIARVICLIYILFMQVG